MVRSSCKGDVSDEVSFSTVIITHNEFYYAHLFVNNQPGQPCGSRGPHRCPLGWHKPLLLLLGIKVYTKSIHQT